MVGGDARGCCEGECHAAVEFVGVVGSYFLKDCNFGKAPRCGGAKRGYSGGSGFCGFGMVGLHGAASEFES